MKQAIGKVVQIIGPVLDIRFESDQLPAIMDAVRIEYGDIKLTAEVAQHIGDNTVRCIAMSSTDGLVRGIDAVATGAPISVPVGAPTLGRIFNVLGEAIDDKELKFEGTPWPIHREAPPFDEQETASEILETGIKVVDLIALMLRVVRSVCSVVQVLVRRFLFKNLSIILQQSTVVYLFSLA